MGNCSSVADGAAAETVSVSVAPAEGMSGEIRRNKKFRDRLIVTAFDGSDGRPAVYTCYDAFQRGLAVARDSQCFGFRTQGAPHAEPDGKGGSKMVPTYGAFEWRTYGQIGEIVDNVGSAVAFLDLATPNDTMDRCVGIYGKNRWEWSTAQHALFRQGAVSVPLYDTLGEPAVTHIVQQTGMATIFCSKAETKKLIGWKAAPAPGAAAPAAAVAEAAAAASSSAAGTGVEGSAAPADVHVVAAGGAGAGAAPHPFATLVNIVQFEDVSEADVRAASEAGIRLLSFSQLQATGAANRRPASPPRPDDKAVICYTSGTTGVPKGAILTHKVMVADAGNAITGGLDISAADVHLSYLPLAHVFEQLVQNALFMVGASMGFYQGDTLKIMEDIKALRPTLFVSVPRLFNRIHDKIRSGVDEAGGAKAALFNKGFAAKQAGLRANNLTHGFWDKLVFGKLKARVGLDRCRMMISGSAPLPSHVMEFLRVVFACRVVEGYGQTECGGAATVTDPADQASLGHVGGPLPSSEIKLVSVPDLGYNVTDTFHGREVDATGRVIKEGIPCMGRGEICFRGPNVFPGYYKDPANTAEALDAEGWLHSGDIGIWTQRGHIKIVDRKKNMFKLAQGEYVAAEKVENVIAGDLVQQVFVHGDSFHSMLLAICVVNPENTALWAAANGKKGDLATLCADPALADKVKADILAKGKARGLQSFEIPKGVILEPVPWTPDDILTPTFKLKRADAKKKYAAQIEVAYAKLETVAGKADVKQS